MLALSFLPEALRHLLSTSSPPWSPNVQVLDLTATDPDLKGFAGGFASGGYGYFAPQRYFDGDFSGKVARVDLATFSQVQVLDLTATDPDLKGFTGGFASGGYGYVSNGVEFGKVARFATPQGPSFVLLFDWESSSRSVLYSESFLHSHL